MTTPNDPSWLTGQQTQHTSWNDPAVQASYASVVKLTGTPATDTANLQAAINAGGPVLVRGNVFGVAVVNGLQIKTGADLDLGGMTLQLAAGANIDLVTVPNFATLTGGNTTGGESGWAIRNGVLDGNGANQTGTSWTFRVYASDYRIDNVEMIHGRSGNAWSEWGSGGSDMEAVWTRFKLRDPITTTATNLDFHGPHDSVFTSGIVAKSGTVGAGGKGVNVSVSGGANPVFTGVHAWGAYDYGWYLDTQALLVNCQSDGCVTGVMAGAQGVTILGGAYYGTRGTGVEYGIQIGDATHTNVSGITVDTFIYNLGANSYPVNVVSSGGQNRIKATVRCDRTTGSWVNGTPDPSDLVEVVGGGDTGRNTIQLPTRAVLNGGFFSNAVATVAKAASQAFLVKGAADVLNVNTSSNQAELVNGAKLIGYSDSYTTTTLNLDPSTGAVRPGTTAGAGARLFSGSGAPTLSATAGDFYFRTGTPSTANQRLYICTGGTSWTGIL